MDDIKVYVMSEEDIDSLNHTTKIYSNATQTEEMQLDGNQHTKTVF